MRSRRVDPRLLPAKARLDTLSLYPEPVRLAGVRIRISPLFFSFFSRDYHGMATRTTIWLKDEKYLAEEGLLTHELCHVWQVQHRYWHVWKTYLSTPYADNPYEVEARAAVRATAAMSIAPPHRAHLRLVSG